MRNLCPPFAILALLGTVSVSSAGQGTITGLTVSPPTADVGATITATATGAPSPCGAVFIDWGDGAARTYATASLAVTETHVYKTAGTFNVRFQGQGNC